MFIAYLVGDKRGDPMFSSVGVNENIVLSPQCFGPCPGSDGLLEGLVQKFWPCVQTKWLDGCLTAFTVYIYLEWTSLKQWRNIINYLVVSEKPCGYVVYMCGVYSEALRLWSWKVAEPTLPIQYYLLIDCISLILHHVRVPL